MDMPVTGFTIDLLVTQAGLTLAVLLFTQLFKLFAPTPLEVRISAVLVGVTTALIVQGVIGAGEPSVYVAATFNGLLAAFSAMKTQESLKHGLAAEVITPPLASGIRKKT